MQVNKIVVALVMGAISLAGCEKKEDEAATKKVVGVLDETNLNEIMLTVADPNEAVTYFQNALLKDPERMDLQRGLAESLARAKRSTEAGAAYEKLFASSEANDQDRINYAETLVRAGEWTAAKAQLNQVPPTIETFQRYRLEAVIADGEKNWEKADSFYETAVGLTTQPSNVLNNWGFSKLSRGQNKEAERLFIEAITFNPKNFTAKNNLVLSRAERGIYSMPAIVMSEEEHAELTYTAGLSALKQGKTDLARGLIQEAIDLHPRYFSAAVTALKQLDSRV